MGCNSDMTQSTKYYKTLKLTRPLRNSFEEVGLENSFVHENHEKHERKQPVILIKAYTFWVVFSSHVTGWLFRAA
jgi:hypothetical protein